MLRCLILLSAGLSCTLIQAAEPAIDFNRDIRPILFNNCISCHGPDEKSRKADLRLDTFEDAKEALNPGKPESSELLNRVRSHDAAAVMPPPKSGKKLTESEIKRLEAWIRGGGQYARHWSYVKPVRPAVPTPAGSNPIDAFLQKRLSSEGLKYSPVADRATLIRRAALDLTGLPPTEKELDEYLADTSPRSYEVMIDRLLAKPAFGEHWARMWLDLARYADSSGYASDPVRSIWPYRDYVIDAFNANIPFDQFTLEQIAGDLLPNPTPRQLTATAFHRNTMTNTEGGTSREEFRNAAVVDRVNTTFAVWMGTSMACAQCHTHKYDPITQEEYFKVFAILNNTEDADRADESPKIGIDDTPEKQARRAILEEMLANLPNVKADDEHAKTQKRIADDLRKWISDLQPKQTVPVMRELPAGKRRMTKLQHRGNFLDVGAAVTEGVPTAFHPLPANQPVNRLALAKWLASPENPLTARVTVNRFWEQLFGNGLVRTVEEFGAQGDLPSHPELLDWLAVEFMESKWDVKKLLKLMVLSDAYRQTSRVTKELLDKDPDNRLLSRGPRVRLTAEMLRDQTLAVSGLLSTKMHGPPVRPPQPNSGLTAAFGGKLDWNTSTGEDRYRRGIYTEWRRTNPFASMAAFDAPSREACTLKRFRSNTPLQAVVALNDPAFIEAAQALGTSIALSTGTPGEKVTAAFRKCLSRNPSEAESKRLVTLFTELRQDYSKDALRAAALANLPAGPLPRGVEVADVAAWTAVSNVLLNLDEFIMKR